ncbi:MAG: 1-deoxy-D-xylulose-5-phosphate reductoisomerase, partial [Gemmatimonadaceae bacterium]|nr:1-deoxy-D-xylulose-5-phosphate reductoisomerase [Gemmatimonadaceae bacterium]
MATPDHRVGVALLGATGSIGKSALRVLDRQRERFTAVALTANGNLTALAQLEASWSPAFVGLVQEGGDAPGHWGRGPASLVTAATHPDVQVVINAVVGAAGLDATLAALRAGKRVALANKETLVMAGRLGT